MRKAKRSVKYVKVIFKFDNVKQFEVDFHSIHYLSEILGMNISSLRRLIYDQECSSKKFKDFNKHVEITPIYT